jgi:hypothetical protein
MAKDSASDLTIATGGTSDGPGSVAEGRARVIGNGARQSSCGLTSMTPPRLRTTGTSGATLGATRGTAATICPAASEPLSTNATMAHAAEAAIAAPSAPNVAVPGLLRRVAGAAGADT